MRVAVLSDIHSNLVALEAVLAQLGSIDALWVAGDLVGYGPEPSAVVARIRESNGVVVRGNHDDAAAGGESIESFSPDAYAAMIWTRRVIDEETRAYLAELPEAVVPEGLDVTLVHGSPLDPIWEYLDSTEAAAENVSALSTRYGLVGHTHVPVVFRQTRRSSWPIEPVLVGPDYRLDLDDRKLIANPGSVGQPRDGDWRASYMTIDTDRAQAVWHRLAYDVAATQTAMARTGLPQRLARRLEHGL